ncbi:Bax inhibitor-1/YccA family protein [Peribacillus glennii]|uniref:Bax inhibitor-1/YccA family protein n=1 Tax=Peribacillus glennii TaxID=2303991 RepID=A0A372LJC7_9BACI|nr:Bax inhibitor-1/YccA family protein [Peribacillus glennii]RFU66557.1 Bax inhibitor-1/YccA family protein [Peribacillus glennii]
MYSQAAQNYMPSVLRTFALSLAVSVLGMAVGMYVPPALFLPLAILELIMLIGAFMLRRRKAIGYTFLYTFTFISGVTTYPIVSHYAAAAGTEIVLLAGVTTTAVFGGLALYAGTTKRDFSFLGGMLMAALLALIVIGVFNIFVPLSSTAMLAYSFIGILVFSGYVLYDINRMKRYGVSAEEVPLMALSLYLDFINLFVNILRFFGILSSRD